MYRHTVSIINCKLRIVNDDLTNSEAVEGELDLFQM